MKSLSLPYYTTPNTTMMRCCSTGHPVLADPLTGRTVCSCQMQSGVPEYLSRVPSLPENFYKPESSDIYKSRSSDKMSSSAFISTGLSTAPPTVHPYYLDQMMAAQSYGALYAGIDINGIRRKHANREATGPLKSWLFQHKKNPYPTKGEKIMLAIISQMTLTQVSTWFANARRRLKKESKMEEKDLDLSDIEVDDSGSHHESFSSRLTDSDSETSENKSTGSKSSRLDLSDVSDTEDLVSRDQNPSTNPCVLGLISPDGRNDLCIERNSSPDNLNLSPSEKIDPSANCGFTTSRIVQVKQNVQNLTDSTTKENNTTGSGIIAKDTNKQNSQIAMKPKIWSIASMIS